VTDKQPAPAPSALELRQEARAILDQIKVTADREVKRQLAVRAFELVQQAEHSRSAWPAAKAAASSPFWSISSLAARKMSGSSIMSFP